MKSMVPWFCLTMAATAAFSETGLDAYREGHYTKANQSLSELKQKDPMAYYYLARMRLYGYGDLKNDAKALDDFKQSAEKGFLPAQNIMARYALLGAKNPQDALYWFKKAADGNNDLASQMYCAGAYLFGYGVGKNEDMARKYYIAAAKNGHALAQATLAQHFLEDKHGQSKTLGMLWLNKSLAQKNPMAEVLMAKLLAKGLDGAPDFDKARALLDDAINQHYPQAIYEQGELARMQGDMTLAKTWYLKAANEQQDPRAAETLSALYANPKSDVYNLSEAEVWKQKSIRPHKQTDDEIQKKLALWLSLNQSNNLATIGYGLPGILGAWTNPIALKQNHYNAAPQMGILSKQTLYQPQFELALPNSISLSEYYDALNKNRQSKQKGEIVFPKDTVDESLSLDVLKNRAVLGQPMAQFLLAQRYHHGIGVEKNAEEAEKYYKLSAEQQNYRALYALGILTLEQAQNAASYQQGVAYLSDAAFKGNAEAQYVLGQLYEFGRNDASGGVWMKPDVEKAKSMYYLSSANQNGMAQYRLAQLLVGEPQKDASIAGSEARYLMLRGLYEHAVAQNVQEAQLPLAFYDAMDKDPKRQQQAFEFVKEERTAKNPQGALLLGLLYDRGIGVSASSGEAWRWYQASNDGPVHDFIVGTYLFQQQKDLERAEKLLQASANAGFSYAYLNLAIIKHQKNGDFLPDLNQALALGNRQAGLLLADYYVAKANDAGNLQKARDIYQQFAQRGDATCQLKLAYMMEHGLGGAVGLHDAQTWYEAAANQGQVQAQYLLGHYHQLGLETGAPNYDAAKKWYAMAEKNDPKSALALGFIEETVDDAYDLAKTHYDVAWNNKNPTAAYNLGLVFEEGKGRPVDYKQAEDLYRQAANLGHPEAMTQLAGLYLNGNLGYVHFSEARSWYEKAALKGNADAQYALGVMAEKGQGMYQNLPLAFQSYQASAKQGHIEAMLALARMYQNGLGVAKNQQQALDIYHQLALKGNLEAQQQLKSMEPKPMGSDLSLVDKK